MFEEAIPQQGKTMFVFISETKKLFIALELCFSGTFDVIYSYILNTTTALVFS